jgi:hypothetical protein
MIYPPLFLSEAGKYVSEIIEKNAFLYKRSSISYYVPYKFSAKTAPANRATLIPVRQQK